MIGIDLVERIDSIIQMNIPSIGPLLVCDLVLRVMPTPVTAVRRGCSKQFRDLGANTHVVAALVDSRPGEFSSRLWRSVRFESNIIPLIYILTDHWELSVRTGE